MSTDVEEQGNIKVVRDLYQKERAAELRRHEEERAVSGPETTGKVRGPHTPVSSKRTHVRMGRTSEPEFGSLGKQEAKSLEVEVASASELTKEVAPANEELLLDAYWAGSGSASVRALLRRQSSSVLEVVIGADDRVQVTATRDYPWRTICSLLITAANSTSWIGTAWLVSPRLLLTAGHCVYMHDQGGWAQQIEVIPGRNGDERPFASCVATDLRSVEGWTESQDRSFDYGAILLPESCRYGDQLGWFGYAVKIDEELKPMTVNLSGYPGDKPVGTQWFHTREFMDVGDRILTYDMDTAGGQSGAPVWFTTADGARYGVGIHTNGDLVGNSATRITSDVYANIVQWVAEVP